DAGRRVGKRDRVVDKAAGFEDDAVEPLALGRLQPVDQLALVTRLAAVDGAAAAAGVLADPAGDIVERDLAVDAGLAGAEQVQIRAVQDEDLHDRRELSISGRRGVRRTNGKVGAPSVSSRFIEGG